MIVWGSILLGIGLYMMILSYAFSTDSAVSDASAGLPVLIIGGMITAGGVLLLVFGIISAVKTTKYNNEIISRNELFTTNCIYCGRSLSCTVKDFKYHRNYPAGYVDCPYCRGHISRNAFAVNTGYQQVNYQPYGVPPQNGYQQQGYQQQNNNTPFN